MLTICELKSGERKPQTALCHLEREETEGQPIHGDGQQEHAACAWCNRVDD